MAHHTQRIDYRPEIDKAILLFQSFAVTGYSAAYVLTLGASVYTFRPKHPADWAMIAKKLKEIRDTFGPTVAPVKAIRTREKTY